MAERKLFIGPRIRRIRNRLGLSQAEMAKDLQISTSYMNLIERNQRPLTVQILLKLASTYQIDIAELEGGDVGETVERLKEAFADPLLANELPSPTELIDIAESAPNVMRGFLKLFDAFNDLSTRIATGADSILEDASAAPIRSVSAPHIVQRWFEENGPSFKDVEDAADQISDRLIPRDDLFGALKGQLREKFGTDVRIVPHHVLPDDRARFDRHGQRIFLSEGLPHKERTYFCAVQFALIGSGELLDDLTAQSELPEGEPRRIARMSFAHKLALAMLMPRDRFLRAATAERYDTRALSMRFGVLEGRIMERLASIKLSEEEIGPEFSCVISDAAGSIVKKINTIDVPLPHLAQLSSRLPYFDTSGQYELISFTEKDQFVVKSCRDILFHSRDYGPPQTRVTSLLVRDEMLPEGLSDTIAPNFERTVGTTCRLCQQRSCPEHTMSPATRPVASYDYALGMSDFDPA